MAEVLRRVTSVLAAAMLSLPLTAQPVPVTEDGHVAVDLDVGFVTGYNDRIQFPVALTESAGKACSRQMILSLELGGHVQAAVVRLEYGDGPQLWTLHASDSLAARGYGGATAGPGPSSLVELHVVNKQMRLYSRWPRDGQDAASSPHSQWRAMRVLDSTVRRHTVAQLTLSLRRDAIRWQDDRLAHDFSAPPGLFQTDGLKKNRTKLYFALNRAISGSWVSGSGLCKVDIRLMDTEVRNGHCADQCKGSSAKCDPNAVCRLTRKSYHCFCKTGWEGDGKRCRDIDECRLKNGGCVHLCHNTPGSYACSCLPGFSVHPSDEHDCVDVDECGVGNGGCRGRCTNTVGSYFCSCDAAGETCMPGISPLCVSLGCEHDCAVSSSWEARCTCPPGHRLDPTNQRSCQRTCSVGNGGCQHHCLDTDGGVVCTCQHGYLLGRDGRTCAASCALHNGNCHKHCTNTEVGVTCSCPAGYDLSSDNRTCTDVDECAAGKAGCQHQCVNTVGSYECICPDGFKVDPADEKTCVDMDECSANSTCEHRCANLPGSYRCECYQGYQLFGTSHCGVFMYSTGHGKILVRGVACPQKQYMEYFSKAILSKIIQVTNTNCAMEVNKLQCLNSERIHRKYEEDVFQLDLLVKCPENVTSECRFRNATCAIRHLQSVLKKEIRQGSFSINQQLENTNWSVSVMSARIQPSRDFSEVQNDITYLEENSLSLSQPIARNVCVAGEYWSSSRGACKACPKDSYQQAAGQSVCHECPEDSRTDDTGSTSVDDCKRTRCGSFINELQGFVETPNFPGHYPSSSECTWVIKPPKGRRILFIAASIDLTEDGCHDHFVIRKNSSPYSVITFEACRSVRQPIAFTAQTKKVWIQFKSVGHGSARGFHIPFVTYNEEYHTLVEDIVQDSRLYSSENHLRILQDKILLAALMEVIAQPVNYYKYSSKQHHMFPSSFIRLITPKVKKFFSYR